MAKSCLVFIPIILAVLLFTAMTLSYLISVSVGHVPPFLPFISDAGVHLPERSVFAELLNLSVILHFVMNYLRFEMVRQSKAVSTLAFLNRLTLFVGCIVAFALTLIANFQLKNDYKDEPDESDPSKENASQNYGQIYSSLSLQQPNDRILDSELEQSHQDLKEPVARAISGLEVSSSSEEESSDLSSSQGIQHHIPQNQHQHYFHGDADAVYRDLSQNIHWTGAFFAFVIGTFWMLLNSYLTVRLKEGRKWRIVSAIRWVLTAIYAGSLTMGIAFAVMAADKNEASGNLEWSDSLHNWDTEKGRLSVMSAICEWICCTKIIFFCLSFTYEFSMFKLRSPIEPVAASQMNAQNLRETSSAMIPATNNANRLYPDILGNGEEMSLMSLKNPSTENQSREIL